MQEQMFLSATVSRRKGSGAAPGLGRRELHVFLQWAPLWHIRVQPQTPYCTYLYCAKLPCKPALDDTPTLHSDRGHEVAVRGQHHDNTSASTLIL